MRARGEQRLGHVTAAGGARELERRDARVGAEVGLGARVEEQADDGQVASQRRQGEGGLAVGVLVVDARASCGRERGGMRCWELEVVDVGSGSGTGAAAEERVGEL